MKAQNQHMMLIARVQLGIDYTRLARIAITRYWRDVAKFLIGFEKKIEKKIPFYLEVRYYKDALQIAIENGDPNMVGKVLKAILYLPTVPDSKTVDMQPIATVADAVRLIGTVPDGLRFLRNYCKRRMVIPDF